MEIKDSIILTIAILGWAWAVAQFFINRKLQKKDKLIEHRFEVYSGYMKKSDELMNNLRKDPKMIYGFPTDFFKAMLNGSDEEIDQALVSFNDQLRNIVKNASEPLMILKQELSTLLLVCSESLRPKIEQYKILANEHNEETLKILSSLSSENFVNLQSELNTYSHDNRWRQFETLNEDILRIMRSELGYR